MSHTPGPWKREGRFIYALGDNGINRFMLQVNPGGLSDVSAGADELEANARLIAAAPKMWQLVQLLVLQPKVRAANFLQAKQARSQAYFEARQLALQIAGEVEGDE